MALGIERGYNYFVANFNTVIMKLFTLPVYDKPENRFVFTGQIGMIWRT
jgi:hypothetical protein